MAVKKVEYKVEISVDDKDLNNLGSKIKEINNSDLSKITSSFKGISLPIIALNQGLTLAIYAFDKITGAVKSFASSAISLEKSVAQINTIVTEAEKKQINFSESIIQTQNNFGTSQQDTAKAYYDTIGSGAIKASDAQVFFNTATKLSIGGVTSLASASDVLTSVIAAYGYEASNAAAISDALFIAARDGKTDISQLSQSIGQALSMSNQLGVGFDELVSAISAVTLAGVSTSEATTAVRAAIVALTRPTADLQSLLQSLGITSVQNAVQQEGLVKVLRKLTTASGGGAEAIVQLFGRVEALSAVSALTSDTIGKKFDSMYASVKESSKNIGSVTDAAFSEIANTADFKINIMQKKFEILTVNISKLFGITKTNVISEINSMLDSLNNFVSSASNAFSNMPKLDFKTNFSEIFPLFAIISSGLLLFISYIATSTSAISVLSGALTFAIAALKGFMISLAPILATVAPILAITAAITTITIALDLLFSNVGKLTDVFKLFFYTVSTGFLETINYVLNLINKIPLIGKAINDVLNFVGIGTKNIEKLSDKTAEKMSEISDNLDFGLAGQTYEKITEFMDNFNNKTEEVKTKQKDLSKEFNKNKFISPDEKTITDYNTLINTIKNLQISINKLSMTESEAIVANLRASEIEITKIRDKLIAENRYTAEKKKNIELLMSLTEKQASYELDAARKKEMIDRNAADIDVAKMIGDESAQLKLGYEKQLYDLQDYFKKYKIDTETQNEIMFKVEQEHQKNMKEIAKKNQSDFINNYGSSREKVLNDYQNKLDDIDKMANKPKELGGITPEQAQAAKKQLDNKLSFDLPVANVTSAFAPVQNAVNGVSGMVEGVAGAFTGIVGAIAKIPQILDGAIDIVDNAMQAWLDLPTKIFDKFVASNEKLMEFPQKFLSQLGDNLPRISEYFTKSIADTGPRLITSVLKGIPRLIGGLIRSIPAVIKGFINGFIDGIMSLGQTIKDIFSGNIDFGKSMTDAGTKAVDAVGKSVTGVGAQLFGFVEAEGVQKAQANAVAITDATNKSAGVFERLWAKLTDIWNSFYNKFKPIIDFFVEYTKMIFGIIGAFVSAAIDTIMPSIDFLISVITDNFTLLGDILANAWDMTKWLFVDVIWGLVFKPVIDLFVWLFVDVVWKLVFKPIIEMFKALWDFVVTVFDDPVQAFKNLWSDLKNIFSDAWKNFTGAFDKLGDIFSGIWEKMKTAVEDAFKIVTDLFENLGTYFESGFAAIKTFFSTIGETIWNGIKSAWGSVASFFSSLFTFEPSQGSVETWLGIDIPWVKFAEGGFVQGKAVTQGDSLKNDIIPAMLSPGELVLPRSVTQDKELMKMILALIKSGKEVQFKAKGDVWDKAWGGIKSAGSAIVDVASSVGSTILDAGSAVVDFVVPDFIQDLFNSMVRFASNLSITELMKDPTGYLKKTVADFMSIILQDPVKSLFQQAGGLFMADGGLVTRGTDTVPAMLTPGEYVLNKGAVQQLGSGLLDRLNSGNLGGGGSSVTNVELTLTINTEQPIDERYIKQTLMPTIRDELRRNSLDGRRVLATTGVR